MLATPRCALNRPTSADVPAIVKLMTHPEVRRYLGGPAMGERAAAYAAEVANGKHPTAWTVHLRENPAVGCVGLVQIAPHHDGFDIEISYEFLPTVWGTGIASEAVRAVVAHALGPLSLTRLIAETQTHNRSSKRLLERVGMRYERDLKRFGVTQAIYAMESAISGRG